MTQENKRRRNMWTKTFIIKFIIIQILAFVIGFSLAQVVLRKKARIHSKQSMTITQIKM